MQLMYHPFFVLCFRLHLPVTQLISTIDFYLPPLTRTPGSQSEWLRFGSSFRGNQQAEFPAWEVSLAATNIMGTSSNLGGVSIIEYSCTLAPL